MSYTHKSNESFSKHIIRKGIFQAIIYCMSTQAILLIFSPHGPVRCEFTLIHQK